MRVSISLYHLHHRSECDKPVLISFRMFLLQGRRKLAVITLVIAHAAAEILHCVGNTITFVLFQQPAHPVFDKHPGIHHRGDMHLFHPLQPLLLNVGVNFYGDVVDNHSTKVAVAESPALPEGMT